MDPVLIVLGYSSLAALMAGLGALPLAARRRPPLGWLGFANALAGGTMLGVAYLLSAVPVASPLAVAAGAVAGILAIHGSHRAAGTSHLALNRLGEADPVYGFQVLLASSLHAAAEGVAIGVAMRLELSFGILLALALAVHNIPEGLGLAAVLQSRGLALARAAALAVAANASQVFLAVGSYAVLTAAPALVPWALGFAVGALVQLVLAELFAEAYRQAGTTSIALAAVAALGIVVLADGLLR